MEKVLLEHCLSGSLSNLESLLKRGISPNIALNSSRQTVFVAVCKIFNCLTLGKDFSILGELKKNVDKWMSQDVKKLQLKFHLEKVIKLLVQYSGSPEFCDISGNNALHLCAETRNLDILTCFFDKGINPNLVDVNNNSVLHLALSKSYGDPAAFTEYVITHGVDVNILNKAGLSALHLATQNRHFKSALVLIENGASCKCKSLSGDTPLILACLTKSTVAFLERSCSNEKKIVEALILRGADINARSKSGRTALHHATMCFHNQIIETLLQNGANVNLTDVTQKTPLHIYLGRGRMSRSRSRQKIGLTTVLAFIEAGAEIMATDSYGQTPLCCMFLSSVEDLVAFADIIKLFLKAGLALKSIPAKTKKRLQVFALETNDWSFIEKTIVVYGWKYTTNILHECAAPLIHSNEYQMWNIENILTVQNEVRPLGLLTAERVRHLLCKNAVFGVKKLQLPVVLESMVCPV